MWSFYTKGDPKDQFKVEPRQTEIERDHFLQFLVSIINHDIVKI